MRIHFVLAVVVAALIGASLAEEKADHQKEYGTVIGIDLGTTYSW